MTRTTLAACGVYAFVTAAVAAQTPATPPGQRPAVAVQPMSLTGCLKPWDPSTMDTSPHGAAAAMGAGRAGTSGSTGTSGTSGAAAGSGPGVADGAPRFVLTSTEETPPSGGGTTPQGSPSPTTNPTPALGAHGTYILEAQTASLDFAAFANQQVRVTGTMMIDAASRPRSAPATTTASQQAGAAPLRVTFKVDAITMVAKSCP